MTGRGWKSQKPLSLSWRTRVLGPRGILIYSFPPYRAEGRSVMIRTGNDLPLRVQSRQGEPRGL